MPPSPLTDPFARLLTDLLDQGHVPASRLSDRSRGKLRPLLDARVLEFVRYGSGRRLRVNRQENLEQFARQLFPSGLQGERAGDKLPPRARQVAFRRDAKQTQTSSAEIVLLRGNDGTLLKSARQNLPIGQHTKNSGVASFVLSEDHRWRFSGTLALVENTEVFLHYEALALSVDAACLTNGRMSQRLIRWLRSDVMKQAHYLHLGDYDPVGLDEYLRLKEHVGQRVALHIPAKIKALFSLYGKRSLVQDSTRLMPRLRDSSDDVVRYISELIDRYGAGLEQEALLLQGEDDRA